MVHEEEAIGVVPVLRREQPRIVPPPVGLLPRGLEEVALWREVYDAVTTRGGRYVQGGGCLTVGVAGLVQSGGFGSFSKVYGLAVASLLAMPVPLTPMAPAASPPRSP